MTTDIAILCICAAAMVGAVRVLLIPGIEVLCVTLHLSTKTKGQVIGYATSIPEFVVVISSAFAGVFDAGFWNIAASNIINCVLFVSAVAAYRQQLDLLNIAFADEIVFCVLSVLIPLAMFKIQVELTISVAFGLLICFAVYKAADRWANPKPERHEEGGETPRSTAKGAAGLLCGVALILVAGKFMGAKARVLIVSVGTPAWLIGWILGLITSLPELTSFFEIYRLSKKSGRLDLLQDTQEGLDALVASNMSNLGVILPVGMIVFCLVGSG